MELSFEEDKEKCLSWLLVFVDGNPGAGAESFEWVLCRWLLLCEQWSQSHLWHNLSSTPHVLSKSTYHTTQYVPASPLRSQQKIDHMLNYVESRIVTVTVLLISDFCISTGKSSKLFFMISVLLLAILSSALLMLIFVITLWTFTYWPLCNVKGQGWKDFSFGYLCGWYFGHGWCGRDGTAAASLC